MLPLRDENPKPVGYKPYITYAIIAINVIVFFWEIVCNSSGLGIYKSTSRRNVVELWYNSTVIL